MKPLHPVSYGDVITVPLLNYRPSQSSTELDQPRRSKSIADTKRGISCRPHSIAGHAIERESETGYQDGRGEGGGVAGIPRGFQTGN